MCHKIIKHICHRCGYFCGLEINSAGITNDQGMLRDSAWNSGPDILTSDGQRIGCDEGYWSTQYINVTKPYSKEHLDAHPEHKPWNKAFNIDRSLIERMFGILKCTFRIFDQPWRRHKDVFPLALSVSLKLLNKYWRLPQNCPPGLKRQYDHYVI